MSFVFDPPPRPCVPVLGGGAFPIRRIFCIGRNYADHVKEMGGDPKSDPPVFFTKPADAVVAGGAVIPYPQATSDLHYEGELVVALKGGGRNLAYADEALIFGYACGCDLTRRDLQAAAKKAGGPWDAAKGFDNAAPVGAIARAPQELAQARLRLAVNGETRQDAALKDMIRGIPEILIGLSTLFELKAGDLVFTGSPAGVGPLRTGDRVDVTVASLPPLSFSIG